MLDVLMRSFLQLLVAIVATIKRAVYEPIANWWLSWAELWVSTSEESTKSVIRESFAVLVRVINGASAWFVSLFFDRSYYQRLRLQLTRPNPWSAWWDNDCNSTFNAIIERDCTGTTDTRAPIVEPTYSPQQQQRRLRRRTPPTHPSQSHRLTGSKRNASSDLFQAAAGWAAAEGDVRSGVLEDLKLHSELLVDALFGIVRRALALVRRLLLLGPPKGPMGPRRSWRGGGRRRSTAPHEWTTADIIRAAGYPVELHDVCTPDGYLLQLIRMPRHDARDTVFFLHGIFDTELGWVANGVTGSQAFAAYDAGLDVWLGTSRSNPPRAHVDPTRASGGRYFFYSVNELAVYDVGAQVDAIDAIKQRELYAMQLQHAVMAMTQDGIQGATQPLPLGTSHPHDDSKQQHGVRGSKAHHHKHPTNGHAARGWRVGSRVVGSGGEEDGSPTHLAQQPPKRARSDPVGRAGQQQPYAQNMPTSHPLLHPNRGGGRAPGEHLGEHLGEHGGGYAEELFTTSNTAWYSPSASRSQSSGDTTPRSTTPPLHLPLGGGIESPGTPGRKIRGGSRGNGMHEGASTPELCESPRPGGGVRSGGGGVHGQATQTGCVVGSTHTRPAAQGALGAKSSHSSVSALKSGRSSASGGSSSSPEAWHDVREYTGEDAGDYTGQDAGQDAGEDAGEDGDWELPEALRVAIADYPTSRGVTGEGVGGGAPEVMKPDLYAQGGVELDPEREAAPISSTASAHLDRIQPELAGTPSRDPQQGPAYRLRAVGHSLGGAMLLMYAVHRRMEGKPHHLSRLVLLTPAGMLREYPLLAIPFMVVLPVAVRVLAWVWPGRGAPVFLPFWWLRTIFFKLAVDLQHMPALQQLVVALIRWVLSQDPSEWDAAMRMPHYNAGGMPVLAFHVGHHMCQWVQAGAFRMYDYGSAASNHARYGTPTPPNIGGRYNLLDVPVDLLAGRADGIVSSTNVLLHFEAMRRAGTRVTYKEFNFGHLDFTFAVKEELRHYVLSRLLLKA